MTLSQDCKQWLEAQAAEFLQPEVDYLSAGSIADEECLENTEPGWYARLSAPGYLDCTDWVGPYDTEEEALEALFDVYGE